MMPTQKTVRGYGWKRDIPDPRDFLLPPPVKRAIAFPPVLSLISSMPAIWDQRTAGACTSFSSLSAYICEALKQHEVFDPSWLFEYFNSRWLEGTQESDSGAEIRDAMKALAQFGVCTLGTWPYDESKLAVRPPEAAFAEAKKNLATQYCRVNQDADSIRAALLGGFPVVFGFSVFESFESDAVATTGIMPKPTIQTEKILGGHAVTDIGWKDAFLNGERYYLIRNSWGPEWGDPENPGHFWMPESIILDPSMCSDFWIIQRVSDQNTSPGPSATLSQIVASIATITRQIRGLR